MNLPRATTDFYVQDYRDITNNQSFSSENGQILSTLPELNVGQREVILRGVKKFSTGPQLSEFVWVVCRNTKGTCLKSVSKKPNVRFFRDSQPLKRLLHTSSQMANFDQLLAKMAKTVKII